MINIDTENPHKHWEFINVKNKIVVDLGCGRWEKVEYRDPSWPTTPEYFAKMGASEVIGIDADPTEIFWFSTTIIDPKYTFICKSVSSIADFKNIIDSHNPDCIKSDIEGAEIFLIELEDEYFKKVKEYYVEVHNDELYNKLLQKLDICQYTVVETINLVHTNGACKVIFAKNNNYENI